MAWQQPARMHQHRLLQLTHPLELCFWRCVHKFHIHACKIELSTSTIYRQLRQQSKTTKKHKSADGATECLSGPAAKMPPARVFACNPSNSAVFTWPYLRPISGKTGRSCTARLQNNYILKPIRQIVSWRILPKNVKKSYDICRQTESF